MSHSYNTIPPNYLEREEFFEYDITLPLWIMEEKVLKGASLDFFLKEIFAKKIDNKFFIKSSRIENNSISHRHGLNSGAILFTVCCFNETAFESYDYFIKCLADWFQKIKRKNKIGSLNDSKV